MKYMRINNLKMLYFLDIDVKYYKVFQRNILIICTVLIFVRNIPKITDIRNVYFY